MGRIKDEEICICNYKHTLRLAFLQRCWSAGWCECFFFDFMCRWRPCGPSRTHIITGWGCPGCMCIFDCGGGEICAFAGVCLVVVDFFSPDVCGVHVLAHTEPQRVWNLHIY